MYEMGLKRIKKGVNVLLLIASLFQIILMINVIYAQSYVISESNIPEKNGIGTYKDGRDILNLAGKFLIGFFSIKQIGMVSAQDLDLVCCGELKESAGGAICQNIGNVDESINRCKQGSLYQTTCENTQECKLGTCIVENGESCLSNSPKAACEAGENSEWDERNINQVPECRKGCCVVGNNANLKTQTQCAQDNGEFIDGVNNEFSCSILAENILEGACVVNGNCRLTTGLECRKTNGDFFAGTLCSNPELEDFGVKCERQDHTGIIEGKDEIFWFDSCGNRENIYDANKDRSWNNGMILSKSQSCNPNSANKNSQTCGNCNINLGSKGSESKTGEASIQDGDFICRDLDCSVSVDLNDDGDTNDAGETYKKKNGESWCIYEGSIGQKTEDGDRFSSDTVGSENYMAECINGEVNVDICGARRSQLCQEHTIEGENNDFTVAQCVGNEADLCLNNNPLEDSKGNVNDQAVNACNDNVHCTVKSVNVDNYFKFDVCVPKYPKGTDLKQPSLADNYCQYADLDCTVVYRKEIDGGWDCVENCHCETQEFSKQMNNLCISLGDCGNYINFKGYGTNDGARITQQKGAKVPSEHSWTNYQGHSITDKDDVIPPKESDLGGIGVGAGSSIENFDVSSLEFLRENNFVGDAISLLSFTQNSNLQKLIGVGGLLTWLGAGLSSGFFVGTGGVGVPSVAFTNNLGTLTYGSYGLVAFGAVVGSVIGEAIAEQYGVTGPAATAITLAGGAVGGSVAFELVASGGQWALGTVGWVGVAIIVVVVLSGWGTTENRIVSFDCRPWQAPSGGDNCELCNDNSLLGCTKYKCESLGQACTLLNANTDQAYCEGIEFEPNPPILNAKEVKTENYSFTSNDFDGNKQIEIRPDGDANGCIPEYTPVEFNIETDEFAQCRYAFEKTANYDEMQYEPLGANYYLKNHTFGITGLGLSALDYLDISGDVRNGLVGDLSIYIRCKDYHGNFNEPEYIVNYCINSGPDETPVAHAYTSAEPENREVISHGTKEQEVTLWINEPAQCRYSFSPGIDYELMENDMECGIHPIDDQGIKGWPCSTTLSDLGKENKIYVRCKDQPWSEVAEGDRNANQEDYEYILRVTENPLIINSIEPQGEVKGGGIYFPIDLEAETSGGANNGKAFCRYEFPNKPQFSGDLFAETGSSFHGQEFTSLKSGNYEIKVTCEDSAGNTATNITDLDLTVDSSSPRIVRAYNENNRLKLITNEDARCFYSNDKLKGCGFNINNATSMSSVFSNTHSVEWDAGKTYFVRCEDLYNNANPSCAITVNPA